MFCMAATCFLFFIFYFLFSIPCELKLNPGWRVSRPFSKIMKSLDTHCPKVCMPLPQLLDGSVQGCCNG
jgi:hypothetical protein